LICFSWFSHFDWQEQIVADATDAEEPDAVGEPNAIELDTGEPDAVEPNVVPEV
jgi:hypothetical protein